MFSLLFSTDILSLVGQGMGAFGSVEFYISQTTRISQIIFGKEYCHKGSKALRCDKNR